MQYHKLIIFVE